MTSIRVMKLGGRPRQYAVHLLVAAMLVLGLIIIGLPPTTNAATTVSIISPTSGSTSTGSSFMVTGTATADRLITVKVNDVEVGTTTSDGSGNWSLEVTGQTAGPKTIEATASVSYAYVPNVGSTNMSIINTITDEVVNTVSTSSSQSNAAISPDGTQMITCSGFGVGNQVKVWSLSNPEAPVITHNLTVAGAHALTCQYTPNGTYFFVSSEAGDFSSGTVTRFNAADPTISAPVTGYNQNIPAAVVFKSDSSTAYVGNVFSSTMSVIDVATNTQTSTFSGGSGSGGGPLMSNDINGYSSSASMDVLVPYNVQSSSFGTPINVGTNPRGPIYNQDQSLVIVANSNDDSLSVVSTSSNTVTDTVMLTAGAAPNRLLFSNDFSKAYLTEGGLDRVSILNPTTLASTGTITVGDNPSFFDISPTESANASRSFTLVHASTGSGTQLLADTGQDATRLTTLALLLLAIASATTVLVLRKRQISK